MATTTQTFQCTFAACEASFSNQGLLIAHKINDPTHNYCKKCDKGFASVKSLMVHKISSEKHMACPICGDEYKSETGRDRHMSQMHAASQDVTCVGCGKVFVRAGGLMAHVEQNECPVLSKDLLAWNRTRKLIQKIEEERVPDILTNSRDLFPSRLPPLANKNQGSQAFSAKDDPVLGVAQLSISNLEKLNPISLGAKNDDAKSVDLLTDPADESVAGFNSLWDDRIPEKPTSLVEPADSIANANDREEGEVVKGEDPRDPTSPNFQPDKFWHAIHKKFSCPYLGCGKFFGSVSSLKQHLLSPTHLRKMFPCPKCHKLFNSSTALVQHCESPTNRCKIRESAKYGKTIDTISGGLLETKGRHADGTIKYNAREVNW